MSFAGGIMNGPPDSFVRTADAQVPGETVQDTTPRRPSGLQAAGLRAAGLIHGSREQIEASRTLMLRVSDRSLRGARQRLERSEGRLSRSLTLLLESRDRVHPGAEPLPAEPFEPRGAPLFE
jgi:hypothetical protein